MKRLRELLKLKVNKLVYIPRFYYIIFRLIVLCIVLDLLSTLSMGLYIGVKDIPAVYTTIAYFGTLPFVGIVLFYGATYLWTLKSIAEEMLKGETYQQLRFSIKDNYGEALI